jgi:hypothetical protein
MEKERKFGLMVLVIRVRICKEKNTVKVYSIGRIVQYTLGNSSTIIFKE